MSQEKDWGKATLVSSQRIKAGTRYYYIDAKLDSKGNKYIVLSETKLKEGGQARAPPYLRLRGGLC